LHVLHLHVSSVLSLLAALSPSAAFLFTLNVLNVRMLSENNESF
jgi:hypothetical protein